MLSEEDFKNYFAGASLAFGVVILTFQAVGIFYVSTGRGVSFENPALFIIYIIPHVVGGVLAGFLVARNKERNIIKRGVVTALLAYILESIYYLIFGRIISDVWSLLGLVIGSISGAFLFQKLKERANL